jgi:hypothetical protein
MYRFGLHVTSPPGRQDGSKRDRIKGVCITEREYVMDWFVENHAYSLIHLTWFRLGV